SCGCRSSTIGPAELMTTRAGPTEGETVSSFARSACAKRAWFFIGKGRSFARLASCSANIRCFSARISLPGFCASCIASSLLFNLVHHQRCVFIAEVVGQFDLLDRAHLSRSRLVDPLRSRARLLRRRERRARHAVLDEHAKAFGLAEDR